MRWLDAFLPELFYGALVSVAVLVVAWALLETWDPHREFIAEARAHVDGPVGKPPAELERLNEREADWPGEVADGERPWDDAELIGRIARLGGDDPTPEFTDRLIAELHAEGDRLAEQRRRAITEGTGT